MPSIKKAASAELDAADSGVAKSQPLASNTSSLSITEMGKATIRPDKVVGFHYFYSGVGAGPLIEVIEGEETSRSRSMPGRPPTSLGQIRKTTTDPLLRRRRGLRGRNRILNSAASEVWRHKTESGKRFAEIDKEIEESRIAPMGPFRLTDMLGLDTVLHVAEHLHNSYGYSFLRLARHAGAGESRKSRC